MEQNNDKAPKKKKKWAEDVFESKVGYIGAKIAKLEEQYLEEAKGEFKDTSNIFQGVAIFVNGYTDPTADVLRRLMQQHGGIYHQYLRSKQTTHLIASNLPYSKIVMYMKSKNPLPLCKPTWITDSIKAGKLLDFRNYLLYSQNTKFQPQLLNIIKSTPNKSSLDNSKNLQSSSLQLNEEQIPTDSSTNNSTNTSRTSTPKGNSKNPLKIDFEKMHCSKSDSINLRSSISESPSLENNEVLNKSDSESKTTEVLKSSTNTVKTSEINETKETSVKNKSSYSSVSSKNSDFISEFYNNSRLHHIATMGATFKDYINELREKSSGKFKGLESLIMANKFNKPGPSTKMDSDSEDDIFSVDSSPNEIVQKNVIMHIDMDCFFVSVGIRNHPELKGQPVAVTHSKGNKSSTNADGNQQGSYSEIASCSYEARKFGLKNGMFLGQALKLCPNLKTIKYDFEGYKEVSYALYDTVASYTLDIEAVSCDEMYVDCSKILSKAAITPLEFADVLRKEIREKTGCPVSTGFGANKLQARLATKKAKPDGKFYLTEDAVSDYVGTLNVKDLPGVGYSTTKKLNGLNVRTCADLQTFDISVLQKEFGMKTGELLYNMCRGIDSSKLSVEHVRKSVSAEVNYGIRFENHLDAEEFLKKLSVEVSNRLKRANAKGRCITLKLMVRAKDAPKEPGKFMGHGLCDYFTKSKNFISSIDETSLITRETLNLWNSMQQTPEDIRGIGIQISRLEIVKNKSNTNFMLKFINKAKQSNTEVNETANKPQEVLNSPKVPTNLNPELNEKKDISKTVSFSSSSEEPFQPGQKTVNFPNELILPSQDIDDSILNELPEEIRKEIAAKKSTKSNREKEQKDKGSVKPLKTNPQLFFREKKNIPRGKVELPPVQELDMAVLIELPEDIRNEILNEYKVNKQSESNSVTKTSESKSLKSDEPKPISEKKIEPVSNINRNLNNYATNEKDFSFSQVDPEFLAALPDDIKNDVEMFCMMKRREKSNAEKKKIKPKIVNLPKSTRGRKPKNVVERINSAPARLPLVDESQNKLDTIKQLDKEKLKLAVEKQETTEKEIATIISHMRSFSDKDLKSRDQEKALSTLVKCMFDLSTDQIRMQIQSWVSNSEIVNETDILSLATYLSMLPGKKLIEDLHVLLKCMHRCITNSGSCVWHEAYRRTVDHVQHYMQIEYNSDLMVPTIRCNLHKCRSDNIC